MPKIFRSMLAEGGMPKVGSEGKLLGVRIPPGPKPDLPVDPNGKVQPQTGGMSVAPDWRNLPYFLIPDRLKAVVRRARGKNDLVCWSLGEGDFESATMNDRLELRVDQGDSPKHGIVEPRFEMPIDDFQTALERTQNLWVIDEK